MKGLAKTGRIGVLAGLVVAWGIGGTAALVAAQQEDRRRLRRGMAMAGPGFDEARPALGVLLSMALDREIDTVGVRVNMVPDGSPAAEAGVERGDVIVSFDGHDLGEPLDGVAEEDFVDDESFPGQRLIALLKEAEAGETVDLVVRRDGEDVTLSVTPEEWREWASDGSSFRWRFGPDYAERLRDLGDRLRDSQRQIVLHTPRLRVPDLSDFDGAVFRYHRGRVRGLDLVAINPGLGAYFGTETGVLVADAEDDSALGLRAGDVVVGIDGRDVEDEEEFRRILRSYEEGDEVRFRIWRDGGETTVTGTME